MKKSLNYLFLLLSFIAILSSCKKDKDDVGPTVVTPSVTMTITVMADDVDSVPLNASLSVYKSFQDRAANVNPVKVGNTINGVVTLQYATDPNDTSNIYFFRINNDSLGTFDFTLSTRPGNNYSFHYFYSNNHSIGLLINEDIETLIQIEPSIGSSFEVNTVARFDLDSFLTANNASREDISEITLAGVHLTICDSSGSIIPGGNFNQADSLNVRVWNPLNLSVPNISIASLFPVPVNTNPMSFVLTQAGLDFIPYLVETNYIGVHLKGRLNTPVTMRKYVKLKFTITVKAQI